MVGEITENPDEHVSAFVQATGERIESSPQMDESNTKAWILEDFLKLLGWYTPTQLELEYSVKSFGNTRKVDYALKTGNGSPLAFLEAKGCDTTLTDRHRYDQLLEYMKNERVEWGILSNGKVYEFYRWEVRDNEDHIEQLASVELAELPKHLSILKAFSRDALESGDTPHLFDELVKLREAQTILTEEKDALTADVVDVLTDATSSEIASYVEPQAKEMIDRVTEALESNTNADAEDPSPTTRVDTNATGTSAPTTDGSGAQATQEVPVIRREELDGANDAKVGVYSSDESGVAFLKEYDAWGFIRINTERPPEYFLIYLTTPHREIRYVGVVDRIVPAREFLELHNAKADDFETYDEAKNVLLFSDVYRLHNPITYSTDSHGRMQGLWYTTLGDLKTADTTDDLH